MEREDLTKRMDWLKDPQTYAPPIQGKRVEKENDSSSIEDSSSSRATSSEPDSDAVVSNQVFFGEAILNDITDMDNLRTISMEGNSYSKSFCMALAEILQKKTTIERALFNNMFVGRKIPDIHPSLKALSEACLKFSCLTVLDMG